MSVEKDYADPPTEVMFGALDGDGSMDWLDSRSDAEANARKYSLPLYRVTITYERLEVPDDES